MDAGTDVLTTKGTKDTKTAFSSVSCLSWFTFWLRFRWPELDAAYSLFHFNRDGTAFSGLITSINAPEKTVEIGAGSR